MEHNLPEEYLDENPELAELLLGADYLSLDFFRTYIGNPETCDFQDITINSFRHNWTDEDRLERRGNTQAMNRIRGYANYPTFSSWGVQLTCINISNHHYIWGEGPTIQEALENALWLHGLEKLDKLCGNLCSTE